MVTKTNLDLIKQAINPKAKPTPYSYKLFMHEGEKYIHFPQDYIFPLVIAEQIIQNCKKSNLKSPSEMQVGLILQIPPEIGKMMKKSQFGGKINKKTKKKNAKKKTL